jgi:hypothetical protein
MQVQAQQHRRSLFSHRDAFNIDCTQNGFQNLTLILKQIQPQKTAPQSATVTLYSLGDNNFYSYDLTSQLSNAAALDQWNTITLSLGPANEDQWTSSGTPQWNNITSLQLTFNYASSKTNSPRRRSLLTSRAILNPYSI